MVGNFMFLDDSISLFGNYSFVGIVLSAIILLAIFVLIIKNAVVPFFKKRANGKACAYLCTKRLKSADGYSCRSYYP